MASRWTKASGDDYPPAEANARFEATFRGALAITPNPKGTPKMVKSSGGGKRVEMPPPRTTSRVEHKAGQKLSTGNKTERSLAGSVLRHIEPRKTGR